MCENKESLKGYLDPETQGILWKKIHDDTISEDLETARRGREAVQQLILAGILTLELKGAWRFSDENMNPYCGHFGGSSVDRAGFVSEADAKAYGRAVWLDRFDNWKITNGKKVITRLELCD